MLKKLRHALPVTLRSLFLRIAILLLLMTITRIVFYFFNLDSFAHVQFTDWLAGIWFDLSTIGLLLMPFIVFSLLPEKWQRNWIIRSLQALTFFIPVLLIVALNLMDTAYYNFTLKRSTADLFAIVSAGNDIGQLLGSFISDYWMLILIFLVGAWLLVRYYNRTSIRKLKNPGNSSPRKELIVFLVIVPLFLLVGRGGFGLRPISSIDATLYTQPENSALVLNSAFTLLKSIGKDDLVEHHYYPENVLDKLFNPKRTSHPQHILPDGTNVMIIMLESFGNEWVGQFNNSVSYTPFLDSLLDKSWYFEYGISNGKKSIEAVPTISASIPTLMDNPYISSAYCNNQVQSLPNILIKHGYSTAFYHGATNGSMRFNSFASQLGYQEYIGRFEYNNDKHFDKTWGILDEYFNPWTAKQITKMKAPFMANLFTLSSHHPYFVPKEWRSKVKKGPHPICKSIHYGDISLGKFFEQAKKEPWFKKTLFVLVADHTPSSNSELYNQRTEMYRIPIAFYDPSGKLPRRREKVIFQQIDIMPTVLDLVNIQTDYYSFGNSYFSKDPREAVTYLEGSYYYFQNNKLLVYSNDEIKSLFDFTIRTKNPKNLLPAKNAEAEKMAKRLKAIIQRYNHDLIHNQTIVR
ncbi:LTA synthase family protein [Fluviicola chungangensis]|uniref:Sulfatase-like hydrolase/transferase n=1 Tax=Fluviicola chungangensis TaxID=2597671 RepID=A0A556N3M3_9FLAO|nr:alkaline phosphatase family protein [Fluviicola chungangensis]TSJ46711.1 sulfatase-like hydrolase/transferase [Fluviicola chungangensis]